jgi:hypothetical protein
MADTGLEPSKTELMVVSGAPDTCGTMELITTSGTAFVICDTGRSLLSTEPPMMELTMVSGAPVT